MTKKYYPDFPEGKTWETMTKEEKHKFVEESVELGYKREYDMALALYDKNGPEWEELTEEQREKVREETRNYHKEMHEFGKLLAKKGGG